MLSIAKLFIAALLPASVYCSNCAVGEIGHGDLRCNSPYLQVNLYSDNGCGNYVTSRQFHGPSERNECVPTEWNGIQGALIANWNSATYGCTMFTQGNCQGEQVPLRIYGTTEGESTKCNASPANIQFESMICNWHS